MAEQIPCAGCEQLFTPARRNQVYCSRPCQRATTRNAKRGSQKIVDSKSAKRLSEAQRQRAWLLNDELYRKSPCKRPAFLEVILESARGSDWHLRRILTDSRRFADLSLDHAGRPNLVRTVDDYCMRTRGERIWKVIAADWIEPSVVQSLQSYRDPWTDPDGDVVETPKVYVQRDPYTFLALLRAMRQTPVTLSQARSPPKSVPHDGRQEACSCHPDQAAA